MATYPAIDGVPTHASARILTQILRGEFGFDGLVLSEGGGIGSVSTPVKELRGFAKVFLQPGETKPCAFRLTPDDLSLYDANLRRVVEPGQFRVMVGTSSEDIRLKTEFQVTAQ